jgi:hypothetical protein
MVASVYPRERGRESGSAQSVVTLYFTSALCVLDGTGMTEKTWPAAADGGGSGVG